MTDRRTTIVEATLAVLAEVPLSAVTTRSIAQRLGLSQPALFRHFPTKGALLLAVVAHAKDELEGALARVLAEPAAPAERIRRLGAALGAQLERSPGLPRLLLAEVGGGDDPALRCALAGLAAAPRAVFAELVREGERVGAFRAGLDAERVGRAFTAVVQGAAIAWLLDPVAGGVAAEIAASFALLLDGLEAGPRARLAEPGPALDAIAELDAGALLARGIEPLPAITAAVDRVGPGGVVLIRAPFLPRPLIALLSGRGHAVRVAGERPVFVEVVVGGRPEVEDLRELEPPAPLERVLARVKALGAGEVYLARLPRRPALLLPRLERLGVELRLGEIEDEGAILRVVGRG